MNVGKLSMSQVGSRIDLAAGVQQGAAEGQQSFGDFLTEAMDGVNKLQMAKDQKLFDLSTGKINDVSEVVIASQKASIAMQLTLQVRNKALDAYQEISRMQI